MLLGEKYKNLLYFIIVKDFIVKKCFNYLVNLVNFLRWIGKKKLKDDIFEMSLIILIFLKK